MEFLNIKPCDNCFFGGGNQFKFGINNFIKSKFTPYPSVFFGAIFTAILSQNDDFRKKFFSSHKYDHEKILKIHQVYLYNECSEKVYISAPKDLFMNDHEKILLGKFESRNNKFVSLSYPKVLESPEDGDFKRVKNKYISISDFKDYYIKENVDLIELIDEKRIFTKGNKIGIKINNKSKAVEDGMLYRIEQVEFFDDVRKGNNKWSYLVEYEIKYDHLKNEYPDIDIKDLNEGYLKLGGENKVCKYEKVSNDYTNDLIEKPKEGLNIGTYKIIFTSDSFFKKDIKQILGNNIEILGIANDKPIYIGGVDMYSNDDGKTKVRKMYKGYAAGTVILINVKKDTIINLKNNDSKGFNEYVILEMNK